jgi:hypothetical protein
MLVDVNAKKYWSLNSMLVAPMLTTEVSTATFKDDALEVADILLDKKKAFVTLKV